MPDAPNRSAAAALPDGLQGANDVRCVPRRAAPPFAARPSDTPHLAKRGLAVEPNGCQELIEDPRLLSTTCLGMPAAHGHGQLFSARPRHRVPLPSVTQLERTTCPPSMTTSVRHSRPWANWGLLWLTSALMADECPADTAVNPRLPHLRSLRAAFHDVREGLDRALQRTERSSEDWFEGFWWSTEHLDSR